MQIKKLKNKKKHNKTRDKVLVEQSCSKWPPDHGKNKNKSKKNSDVRGLNINPNL